MRINRTEFEQKHHVDLDNAIDTGCPFLRYISIYDKIYFVAERNDPCPLKKCGLKNCRNYGKSYDDQERLLIRDCKVMLNQSEPVVIRFNRWLFCRILGWHGRCSRCGKSVMQDSQGNWF